MDESLLPEYCMPANDRSSIHCVNSYVGANQFKQLSDLLCETDCDEPLLISFKKCHIPFASFESLVHHYSQLNHDHRRTLRLEIKKCKFIDEMPTEKGIENLKHLEFDSVYDDNARYHLCPLLERNAHLLQSVGIRFGGSAVEYFSVFASLLHLRSLRYLRIIFQYRIHQDAWQRLFVLTGQIIQNNLHLQSCDVSFLHAGSDRDFDFSNDPLINCRNIQVYGPIKRALYHYTDTLYNTNMKWIRSMVGVVHRAMQTNHPQRNSIVDILLKQIIGMLPASMPAWMSKLSYASQRQLVMCMYDQCMVDKEEDDFS